MDGWEPIETAPKDGTWFVGLCTESIQDETMPKPYVLTTRWVFEYSETWERRDPDTQKRVRHDWSHWEGYETPVFWRPLPSMPQVSK